MFNEPDFQDYYSQIDRIVANKLNEERADYLLQVDPEEYLDHLVADAEWQTLEWDESGMTIEQFVKKVQRRDAWEPDRTYATDEAMFRLRLPVSDHPQLQEYLKFKPNPRRLEQEPSWTFQGGVLVIEVGATEQAVKKAVEDVRYWFGTRNKNIEEGNTTLRARIEPMWRRKRQQLEAQHGAARNVLQKLNIPLHQDPNARAKPVEIKPRQLRTTVTKPLPKGKEEPSLLREDVVRLVEFIDQYTRQWEVTPRTYARMEEEELREIVGMLNVNYPGSTTAETFSKLGKTDIRFQVDRGNVLIAECKVWRGAQGYIEALEQLFKYLTWRQNYGVLVIFCKLKDMSAALEQAKKVMQGHSSFTGGGLTVQSPSRFSTRHQHPQDPARSVEVFTISIDLSL